MSQIRILVDCHVFDGAFQGTTTYLKGIYLEMVKDYNYQFFFAANNPDAIKPIFGQQDNIHYLQYRSHNKFFRLLFDLPRMIRQHKIDYAHFQYIVPPIKKCRYINTVHDVLFLDFPQYFPLGYRIRNKFLFKWSCRRSDIVLTVSEFSKKQIEKHFKINDLQITPNAIDPVYFEPYLKTEIKKVVKAQYALDGYWLYTSRWEPRKNHLALLQVFAENQFYRDYSLVFIGDKAIEDRQYKDYYEGLPDEVKRKILTLHKVDSQALLLLLRGADLSVYPSFAEGFGIPPIEAIAAGIPSVCSNTTAMADFDFMKDYQFDPHDVKQMGTVIQKALTEKTTLSMQTIKSRYNWMIGAEIIKKAIASKK